MPALLYLILACVAVALIWQFARRAEQKRKTAPGAAGCLEYRTALPFDACLDALNTPCDTDEFVYECPRQPDGSFVLRLMLHQPSNQPIDTVYSLRMDAGRQTVVTLHFVSEAFGYKEPVFPTELLDRFLAQKLQAERTK